MRLPSGRLLKYASLTCSGGKSDQTAKAHLALQCGPEEYEAGPWVLQQLMPFGAVIIGEECKPVLIESF